MTGGKKERRVLQSRRWRRVVTYLLGGFILVGLLLFVGVGSFPGQNGGKFDHSRGVTLASAGQSPVYYQALLERKPVLDASQYDWLSVEERSVMEVPRDVKLRIVTYNIRHGEGLDNVVLLDRIAAILKSLEPDIIALQEVDQNFGSRSHWEDQVEILSEKLGMYAAYGPALKIPRVLGESGYYGNAVLSRYPIKDSYNQVINFATFTEPRAYLHTVIETPDGDINFISTHLGLKQEERSRHVSALLAYTAYLEGPVVIAGDFNAVDTTPEIQTILDAGFADAAGLLNRVEPTLIGSEARIDYLFISPEISVCDVVTVDADGSDHRPVMALISIPLGQ